MRSGAEVSDDGLYRYLLWRDWDVGLPRMTWIMLNPSTADAETDDPTIGRCMEFARRERCGGIQVVNLYALRASKPKHLLDHPEPEGEDNTMWWAWVLEDRTIRRGPVLAAWGAYDNPNLPPSRALAQCRPTVFPTPVWCLGLTKGGHPRHPLFLSGSTPLEDSGL